MLDRSLSILNDFNISYEAARTKTILSRAALALGDQKRARQLLTAVAELFESLGAEADLAKVRVLQARINNI